MQPRLLDGLRNFVFDSFQRMAPRQYDPDAPVRVVAIDEGSLTTFGQWPWPRTRLAELTKKLVELGAAAIVFDFVFAEPDRMSLENILSSIPDESIKKELTRKLNGTPTNDQYFAASIAMAPAVLGTTLIASVDSLISLVKNWDAYVESGAGSLPKKAGLVIAGDDPRAFVPIFSAVVAPLGVLANAAAGVGATNWLPDRDQVVRRIPLFGLGPSGLTPSLALEALRVAQSEKTYVIRSSNASGESAFGEHTGVNAVKVGAIEIATGAHGDILPRYRHFDSGRNISAADVLENRAQRSEFDGRIVFVGATAIGLGDVRATPLDSSVPGVEIHAQIVESLLSNKLLSRPDWAPGFEFTFAIVSFAGVAAVLFVALPSVSVIFALAVVALSFASSFYLFDQKGVLVDPAYPSLTAMSAFGIGTVTLWSFERIAKRSIHQAFGKFLAPAVVDQLVAHPERLVLGGETRELTVLFSDLRNFSGLSEGLSAHDLTSFMNDYLTPMTDAILELQGTVDKYIGDAIVAFWNAPLDLLAHPRKAVSAALRMRSALADFNEDRAAKAREAGVVFRDAVMGIGLNLGPCNVGNMGSIRRFDYSILGDTVNLASRLEGVCKIFGVDVVASAAVRDAAAEFAWLDLGRVIVKGRRSPTAIFTIVGDAMAAMKSEFLEWKESHDTMLRAYEAREFADAAKQAERLASHVVAPWQELYVGLQARYAVLAKTDVDSTWSPIRALEDK
jgi:adenylate cyclase